MPQIMYTWEQKRFATDFNYGINNFFVNLWQNYMIEFDKHRPRSDSKETMNKLFSQLILCHETIDITCIQYIPRIMDMVNV